MEQNKTYDSLFTLYNAPQFNQNIEINHKQKIKQYLDAQKERDEVESKIYKVLNELVNMSKDSKQALNLFQKLSFLSPLLANIDTWMELNLVGDEILYQLYFKYGLMFKECQENVIECPLFNDTIYQGNSINWRRIKENIQKTNNKLLEQQNILYQKYQRYVIWVDQNDSKENQKALIQIQKEYETSLIVKYYTDINKFKQDYIKFKRQPIFLILSEQVVNDSSSLVGKLFLWIKAEWQQNEKDNRIRGIIIYTNDLGVRQMRTKFEQDNSKLVKKVTANANEMLEVLNFLIYPNKFYPIIRIDELSALFQNEMKEKLLNMHINPPKQSISYYSNQHFDYKNLFNQAIKVIKDKNINFQPNALKVDLIVDELKKIYTNNNNEQQIAQKIIQLYTQDNVPFSLFINTTLCTLNEILINITMPLIELFQTAIYQYDDSSCKPYTYEKILYRGTNFPCDIFDQYIKIGELICLPSFSSFTEDMNIAKKYMISNNSDYIPCILVYHLKIGSAQYDFRPKFICRLREYVTYPYATYEISNINKVDTYTEITISQSIS
ncbi:hypothetical protein ABPG74_003854 [Tetrahymena malaccensis]